MIWFPAVAVRVIAPLDEVQSPLRLAVHLFDAFYIEGLFGGTVVKFAASSLYPHALFCFEAFASAKSHTC